MKLSKRKLMLLQTAAVKFAAALGANYDDDAPSHREAMMLYAERAKQIVQGTGSQ